MKDWFDGLAGRERRALIIGALAVGAAVLYALVLDPLDQALSRVRVQAEAAQGQNEWMRSAAAQAGALRITAGAAMRKPGSESLLSIIDRSTRTAGLKASVKRVSPDGDSKAHLSLEHAPFDALLAWLVGLARDDGVSVSAITIDRGRQPGLADATLTLQLPPPGS